MKRKRKKCQQITSGLAKLGCKVITRTSVLSLTVSDNPNGVQSLPNFAKPPGRCVQAARALWTKTWKKKDEYCRIFLII